MKRFAIAVFACASMASLRAAQVVDTFDVDNPNRWSWSAEDGSGSILQSSGGDPDGWLESGLPYRTDHPNLTSVPPPGSALQKALTSAELVGASMDFQRLDVGTCMPTDTKPSTFALELFDLHSDPNGTAIKARVNGAASPASSSPWQAVRFTIPSASVDLPDGWSLIANPDLNYTWQDLMHNLDGIRIYGTTPDNPSFSSCWDVGADNVVVTYGDDVFADGFDVPGR